jgi:hypothetical protein
MRVVRTAHCDVPPALLFGSTRRRVAPRATAPPRAHDASWESGGWVANAPIDRARFADALAALPAAVLRGKGLLRLAAAGPAPPATVVWQQVGRRSTLEAHVARAPARSGLVALWRTGSIERAALDRVWRGCGLRPLAARAGLLLSL